jgi:hypothetical protein
MRYRSGLIARMSGWSHAVRLGAAAIGFLIGHLFHTAGA